MNSKNQITGMIAVHDDAALNARLDYAIDVATNNVTYTITCHWKLRKVYGKCPFADYTDARMLFDGLPTVAQQELKTSA